MRRLPTLTALLLLASAAPASAQSVPWTIAADVGLPSPARPTALAVGDFNSDGRQDLVVMDDEARATHLRPGNGDGTFRDGGKVTGTVVFPDEITFADINADGNEDIAVAGAITSGSDIGYARGVGDGKFTFSLGIDLGARARSIAVGDFNSDAWTDVAVAAGNDAVVRTGLDGGPKATLRTPVGAPTRAIASGDFDGNAVEDVAVLAGGDSPKLAVLSGKNTGEFAEPKAVALAQAGASLAVGDLNADGRDDVVAAIPGRDRVVVRLGNGDGSLREGAPDVAVGTQPESVVLADLDADGREDLVTANAGAGTVSVRLGNGDGGFRPAGELAVGAKPIDVVVGDFDADGRQDLAVANQDGGNVAVRLGAGTPPLEGNLLANGGFEQGLGARLPQEAPTIPGWTTTGGMTFARYGISPHFGTPTWLDAPRYGGGRHYLWGGDSTGHAGVTETSQTVAVTSAAEGIDAGRATASLAAYLGGGLAFPDNMTATAEFLDADGAALGLLTIGPVTPADRHNVTGLQRRAGAAAVPARTRRIRVTLTSRDNDRWSSAIADNVKLTLAVRPSPPSPPPPGASKPSFGRRTRVTIQLAARRLPLRVRIANANEFPVTGRLRGKRFAVPAGGRTTVRLPRPKRLRRLRLSAVVTDPAGHRRTISRRVTVRRP